MPFHVLQLINYLACKSVHFSPVNICLVIQQAKVQSKMYVHLSKLDKKMI